MRKILLSAAIAATALLTGCGGIPSQTLSLNPDVKVLRQLPTAPVNIQVQDLRQTPVVGDRIDRLGNRAPILLTNSTDMLGTAVQKALSSTGINTFGPGGHEMTVMLDTLSYDAKAEAVKQIIALNMQMRVKVERNGRSYTGQYATKRSEEFVRTPTPADNEELINALVQETLTRAMNDPRLLEFFQFN